MGLKGQICLTSIFLAELNIAAVWQPWCMQSKLWSHHRKCHKKISITPTSHVVNNVRINWKFHKVSGGQSHEDKLKTVRGRGMVMYLCQWTESSLVRVMTWCLFGTKPLPEPMMTYSLSTEPLGTNTEVKFASKYNNNKVLAFESDISTNNAR